jgi:hypothetical protein
MEAKHAIALIVIGAIILSFNEWISDRIVALYYVRTEGRRISYVSTLKFNFALGICLIVAGGLMLLWLLVRTT